ncbi:MAG: tRNA (adenosine(37)-N6)-threonylcarbamoyltransferase complex ATPase subunit type 1 TsaE [Deltaproteobacteria bacterium RBG_16_50_11]|nr:MAG: tRNA (adenosine(37)-N6)-threonylcarbamoyltransferase complex ATPase subunit type 1 TsaE [Deltaproteobacteria bacterium RBG_16_50_11]
MFFQTKSTSETIRIGKQIGGQLRPGDVVALVGELGTGKTHFIKGLASGAGVKKSRYITSPSFTLIHEYQGKIPFYHIDLFRLKTEKEAEGLGLEEYFQGGGITAIEWADKIPTHLPEEMLWIEIRYTGEHTRSIEILAKGARYEELMKNFKPQTSKSKTNPNEKRKEKHNFKLQNTK